MPNDADDFDACGFVIEPPGAAYRPKQFDEQRARQKITALIDAAEKGRTNKAPDAAADRISALLERNAELERDARQTRERLELRESQFIDMLNVCERASDGLFLPLELQPPEALPKWTDAITSMLFNLRLAQYVIESGKRDFIDAALSQEPQQEGGK